MPLTRLAVYVCSLDPEERAERRNELDHALAVAAERSCRRAPSPLGRVAVVADRSFSTTGSYEKRRRPLAVTLAAVYLLRRAAEDCSVFWAPSLSRSHLEVTSRGQTDLASAAIAALRCRPDTVIIVSDGYENAPTGLVSQVIAAARSKIPDHAETAFVHLNPVFDADNLAPRSLGPALPTVGIRDAEDLLTTLGFARFAAGSSPLAELETYLEAKTGSFIR